MGTSTPFYACRQVDRNRCLASHERIDELDIVDEALGLCQRRSWSSSRVKCSPRGLAIRKRFSRAASRCSFVASHSSWTLEFNGSLIVICTCACSGRSNGCAGFNTPFSNVAVIVWVILSPPPPFYHDLRATARTHPGTSSRTILCRYGAHRRTLRRAWHSEIALHV